MGMPAAFQSVFIVFIVFASTTAMLGLALFIPRYFRAQKRATIYKTVELFTARNQPVPPEIMDSLTQDTLLSGNDLRRGAVLLSVALALIVLGFVVDARPLIGVAAFPGLVGLAFIGLHFYSAKRPA